jgi:hypothetical protein
MKSIGVFFAIAMLITDAYPEAQLVVAHGSGFDSITIASLQRITFGPSVVGAGRTAYITTTSGADTFALSGIDSLTVTPALTILSPAPHKTVTVGDTLTIRWRTDFDRVANGVYFAISPNGGRTWVDLNMDNTIRKGAAAYAGSVGTFQWVVVGQLVNPEGVAIDMLSTTCRVMVKEYGQETARNAVSSAFTITNK